MNDKLKQMGIPFILMMICNLGIFYLSNGQDIGAGLNPHVGVLFISGLLFGPYGAIGSVIANFLCDMIRGYYPAISLISAVFSFGISYLGYKLWYGNYKKRKEVTKPKLNNTYSVLLFLAIIIICGFLYSVLHGELFYLFHSNAPIANQYVEMNYILNFINSSFVFGIIGIWLSNKIDFVYIPEISNKINERPYRIVGALMLIFAAATLIIGYWIRPNYYIILIETVVITVLLFAYLTKPITSNIIIRDSKSIPEEIMKIFHISILFIIVIGVLISYDQVLITAIDEFLPINQNEFILSMMMLTDMVIIIFLIPSLAVLRYIEIRVIEPIVSFSEIGKYIHENEKIETEELVSIYSEYVHEETEIGTLARSYTDLINFNNNYIENIRKIEGEKEHIKAELDIATRIQAAALPTGAINTDDFAVNGYSKPAKEVGGDFFDYYQLDDDNLAVVIGDASGKGVPAALVAMVTQVIIKHMLNNNTNPSEVLYSLNNQLCENNPESMFITLWIGIYNKTTKMITFSNAGHNPPLIKENGKFRYLDIDTGIVLGVMEDFDYVKEEIALTDEMILYTDGITDANNEDYEMYGEERLLNFLNRFENDGEPIKPLLKDISLFAGNTEQYDDMTLLDLRIK